MNVPKCDGIGQAFTFGSITQSQNKLECQEEEVDPLKHTVDPMGLFLGGRQFYYET